MYSAYVSVHRRMALSPADSLKYPCRMSIMILRLMLPVKFKKSPCRSVEFKKWLCRPVAFRSVDPSEPPRGHPEVRSWCVLSLPAGGPGYTVTGLRWDLRKGAT